MEYIFDKVYFHNFSPGLKNLYFAYSLCGGMYYEAYMNIWFKYCWSFFNLCSALLIIFNCIITLLHMDTHDFSSLCVIGGCLDMTCSTFFIVIFTYYWRKNFRKFFEFVNIHECEVATDKNDEVKSGYKKIDFNSYIPNITIVMLLLLMNILIIKLVRYFSKNEFANPTVTIDWIHDYMFPFPLVKSPSPETYVLICILQTFTYVGLLAPCSSFWFLFYIATACLENQATTLTNRIKTRSGLTFEKIEQSFANETQILSSKIAWSLKQKKLMIERKIREKHIEEFFADLCYWIRSQQKLTAFTRLVKRYFEIILEIIIISSMLGIVVTGYYEQKIITNFDETNVEYLLALSTAVSALLIYCWIGSSFAELNIKLVEELNNSPWYYLPPKKRRVFLTFLCITQRSTSLHLFGLHAVTLSLFPKLFKKAYDIIQLMWIVNERKT